MLPDAGAAGEARGGRASLVTHNVNKAATENVLKRLHYRFAGGGPEFSH